MIQKNKKSRILLPLIGMLVLYGCGTKGVPRYVATPVPHATEVPVPVKASETAAVEPEVAVPAEATAEPEATEVAVAKPLVAEQPDEGAAIPVDVQESGTHILLSGSAAAYREIAEQLNLTLDDAAEVHTLTGVEQSDAEIIKTIQASADNQVVAVGLLAARAARSLESKRVVFCQVVNYSDHDLVADNMKGVSALPAPHKLFADWKTLSPQLERVLVVSGKGFDDFLSLAREAAAGHGITLVHKVVDNDREFLYAVKRNKEPVQGHWLLADNRVLSVKTLKEVMAFNSKAAIQTVVFQSELLDFGGLFYVMPSSPEISDKVISRLSTSPVELEISGADILFLDDHLMGINSQVARQLGLEIPDRLKASIYDQ